MRLRSVFFVSTALAFVSLAACEIHTGDGTQPAAPAATTAAPATVTTTAPATGSPILEEEHLATGHTILKTDGGT